MTPSEVFISLLLLFGSTLVLFGAVLLNRFPDVYGRMAATGKIGSLGLSSILVAGTIFFSVEDGLTLKLLLVLPFLYWTASAGAFTIGRAAHRTGPDLAPETIRDDLAARGGTFEHRH